MAQLGQWLGDNLEHNKPSPFARIDTRNSFIAQSGVVIRGLQAGLQYGPTLRLGVGYHFLSGKSARRLLPGDEELHVRYVAPFVEYDFFESGRYRASIPILLGLGEIQKRTANGRFSRTIVLYEAMMIGQYKVTPYFDAGIGMGYRLMLLNNRSFGLNLNSPIYSLKMNIYLAEVWKEWKQ